MKLAVILLLLLASCSGSGPTNPSARPVVRADSGGSAILLIIACPPTEIRAMAVGELIQLIASHEEIVIARNGGSARLTINACPGGGVTAPLAPPRR